MNLTINLATHVVHDADGCCGGRIKKIKSRLDILAPLTWLSKGNTWVTVEDDGVTRSLGKILYACQFCIGDRDLDDPKEGR